MSKRIEKICGLIYEEYGQGAVISFADSIGWDVWQVCEPCEYESPILDNACLVCGSEVSA
jgi:hypothetical protein